MNRKILIAAAVIASSTYLACGGGKDNNPPPATPATMDSSSAATMASDTTAMTASAAPTASTPPPAPKSLYDQLGGKDAIAKVVDSFLANVVGDKRINKRFAPDADKTGKLTAKGTALRQNIIDQITAATGGPGSYTGKDMKTAHKGMKITEADWSAFVEDLSKAIDANGVSADLKTQLLAPLAAMHDDIVEVSAKPKGK